MGGGETFIHSLCQYGLIPAELLGQTSAGQQIRLGLSHGCVLDGRPEFYSIFTSMFMHGGWFHLIGNMWFLAVFGDNVEDCMGPVRFLIFYLLCGFAAALAQVISGPLSTVPMVGASGAIGGVMGAYFLLFPRAPVHMLFLIVIFPIRFVLPAFIVLGYWFLLQLLGGFPRAQSAEAGVAFWAHIGGFVAGMYFIRKFCIPKRLERKRRL